MRRKALIHNRTGIAQTPQGAFTQVGKSWHLHFCSNRDCRIVYDDYRCDDVTKNGRCHRCRGLERPVWDASRDPHECCVGNCTQVTQPDEIVRYRLAGPGPWFQCKTCARCHGWLCSPNERKS